MLYTTAYTQGFDYYHLLSGADLCLRPINEILEFFSTHSATEFFNIDNDAHNRQDIRNKTNYFYPFMPFYGKRNNDWLSRVICTLKIQEICLRLQRYCHISRCKSDWFTMFKGGNWCSLSHMAVGFILSQKSWIRHRFRWTRCPDEIYKQTLLNNSVFAKHRYMPMTNNQNSDLREIDWVRGNPYTWSDNDIEHLLQSKNLFARKFTIEQPKVVSRIMEQTVQNEGEEK